MRAAARVGCISVSVVVLAAATVGGCSSDGGQMGATGATCSANDAGAGDSDASSATGPTSCVSTSAAACPDVFALVAASSDYSSSGLGALATSACESSFTSGLALGGDPALSSSNGHTFWVDREGQYASIYPLDECGRPHGRMQLGSESGVALDPQDVAVDSSCALWIPYYAVPRLEQRSADGTVLHTVDLSSYDSDGNPNASSASWVSTSRGEEIFVTLENLDSEEMPMPEAFSQMLVVDVATAQPISVAKLAGKNPFGLTKIAGSHLYLAEPGSFSAIGEAAAGVERFDPESRSGTLVATESALGGSVLEVAVSSDETCAAAIIADPSSENRTTLVQFDLTSGQVTATLVPQTTGFDLDGLAWVQDDTRLLVGDRSGDGPSYAVHAFSRGSGCALTEEPDAIFVPQAPLAFHAVKH
jgi:hypothetical protein